MWRLCIISKECYDVSYVVGEPSMELTLHKETVVVVEIKEVELRSCYVQFIYDGNDHRIQLQRRGHAPSRLPVKKLRRLLHKKREVRAFVWKRIGKIPQCRLKFFAIYKMCKFAFIEV